jgi:hypothetical protein
MNPVVPALPAGRALATGDGAGSPRPTLLPEPVSAKLTAARAPARVKHHSLSQAATNQIQHPDACTTMMHAQYVPSIRLFDQQVKQMCTTIFSLPRFSQASIFRPSFTESRLRMTSERRAMTAMPWVGGTVTVAVNPHRVGLLQRRQRATRQRYR